MKQTVWLGLLLVVPVGASLLWMTSDGDNARPSERRAATLPLNATEPELQEREKGGLTPPPGEGNDTRAGDVHDAPEYESAALLPDGDLEEGNDPVEESRRIRLPVIQAIRGNHPTPEARREAMLNALRQSGPSDEEWTKQSTTVFDEWMHGISSDVGLRPNWATAQCYQAGCEVELSFPNRSSYERASKEFRSLREEGAAHGGRVQTPAVDDVSGQVRASWIMMRPDGSRS